MSGLSAGGHTGLSQGAGSVFPGQVISIEEAEKLLIKDLAVFEDAV